jgi:3-deoxy-7-phosphoheptulonate synthase
VIGFLPIAHPISAVEAVGDRRIVGAMLESHLEEGRQDLRPGAALRRGVSITDPCLGWAQTEPVLRRLAAAVQARRAPTTASVR